MLINRPNEERNFLDLFNHVLDIDKPIVVLNIGCKSDGAHNEFQERPPFLREFNNKDVEIVNVDAAYAHTPLQRKYCVLLNENQLMLLADCVLSKRAKFIVYDNTCSSGLKMTHSLAAKYHKDLGENFEVFIGYGAYEGFPIFPVMQLNKDFDVAHGYEIVKEFSANYCIVDHTFVKVRYESAKKFAESHNIKLPEGNVNLVALPEVKAALQKMAADRHLSIYFTLDELAQAKLFTNQPKPGLGRKG